MRSGIRLSSLLKSLQLCPVVTVSYLGSLEISRRREVTLLLVSPQSMLPACLPWGALGLQERQEATQPRWTQQGARPFQPSQSHGTAWVLNVGARGEGLEAGGSPVFGGMDRHRGWMALYRALCFLLLLPTPLCMRHVLQFSKRWFAFLPVSVVCHVCADDSGLCSFSST